MQIVLEAIGALVLAIVGATLRTPALREIMWRSEMKRKCVWGSSLNEGDPQD